MYYHQTQTKRDWLWKMRYTEYYVTNSSSSSSILRLFWLAPLQLEWVDYNRHKMITVTGLHYLVQKYSKAFSYVIYTLIIEQQSGVETRINKSWLRLIILDCLCSHPFRYDYYHIISCRLLMKQICFLSGILWFEWWNSLHWMRQKLRNQLTFTIKY